MRLIDFFDKGAQIDPARAFLIDSGEVRSYAATQELSRRIAQAFHGAGIAPGTKVAVYSGNSARAFECVIGIIRAGCIWVPLNARNTVEESVSVLTRTDTEVLFYAHPFRAAVRSILTACPRLTRAFCLEEDDPPHVSLAQLTREAARAVPEVLPALDDVVTLFSSGGTTGDPKGVMMSHLAWQTWISAAQRLFWHEHAIHLVVAPMTHAAGGVTLLMSAMGATNVILPGFDALHVMQAIQQYRVTHLFLPPTAVYRMLAHPEVRNYDYSSLRYFNYASAPMAPEKVKEAMAVFGPVMMTGFGQTELGPNVTFFSPEDHVRVLAAHDERRLTSCGRPTLFARVEIMDEEGTLLPPETQGEIVVRTSGVMKGYYNDPAETARVSADGWHHTGDVGFKDREGWLFLVDRKRDMLISGGFNLFPAEIEKVIVAHPAVQDCAVIGVPDEEWGEAVKAVVELKPGLTLDTDSLRELCRARLSGYKVPKSFEVWAELPRSAAGKVLRRAVRERFWQGRKRRI
ncbi:MAG TPA: AMP-binding protein [Steroidobacteraceae bacterium]|nr:AMP-binding protein [Steroidobacteraceae bacterium]